VKSPYFNEKSFDLDEIWYTAANLQLDNSQNDKTEFLKIQDGGRPPF